jgi:hypothetical protein
MYDDIVISSKASVSENHIMIANTIATIIRIIRRCHKVIVSASFIAVVNIASVIVVIEQMYVVNPNKHK